MLWMCTKSRGAIYQNLPDSFYFHYHCPFIIQTVSRQINRVVILKQREKSESDSANELLITENYFSQFGGKMTQFSSRRLFRYEWFSSNYQSFQSNICKNFKTCMTSLRHQIEIRPEVRTREIAKITRETVEKTTSLKLTPAELEVSPQKEPIKYQIINPRLTTNGH